MDRINQVKCPLSRVKFSTAIIMVWLCSLCFCTSQEAPTTQLFDFSHTWKFFDSTNAPSDAWMQPDYDDSSWPSGTAPFGYPAFKATPLPSIRTPLTQHLPTDTHYFRTHFSLAPLSHLAATLITSNIIEDGVVFYLNGVEAGRIAMPDGEIAFDTLATRSAPVNFKRIDTLEFPPGLLRAGDNVLAVELHQGEPTNLDMVFALKAMLTWPPLSPAKLITQPHSQQASPGDSVIMSFEASGTAPISINWFKNGRLIEGERGNRLRLASVGPDDEGGYSVTVSNKFGSESSELAILSVSQPTQTLFSFGHNWRFHAEGTDLGTKWRAPGYDDSGWSSGPSPLGFPADEQLPYYPPLSGPRLVLETVVNRVQGAITYYFRTDFNFDHEPLDYELELHALFDDGAVVYLNGQELFRERMSDGLINFRSRAIGTVGNAQIESFLLPGHSLQTGTNTLAIEVHQTSGASSDMINGLEIAARPSPLTAIEISSTEQNIEAEELRAVTLSVDYTGNRPRFQWFKDNQPLNDSTRPTLAITNASLPDTGVYHVTISNVANQVVSPPLALTVHPDITPPSMLLAAKTNNSIIVQFSEPILHEDATNISLFVITNRLGGLVSIDGATLINQTNVLLQANLSSSEDYLVFAEGIRDPSIRKNSTLPGSNLPVQQTVQLIEWDSYWRFYDPVAGIDALDLGTEWREPDYPSETSWGVAPGAFIYRVRWEHPPIPIGLQLSGGQITSYFRKRFNFTGSPSGMQVELRYLIDDAAVFYLNGVEIHRYNMPLGAVDYLTPAQFTVGRPEIRDTISLPSHILRAGENLFAAELHQRNDNDPDKVFAAELSAIVYSQATGPISISPLPTNVSAFENQGLELSLFATGARDFQWFQDNIPIPEATNSTMVLAEIPLSANGSEIYAVAYNDTTTATSSVSRLKVAADLVSPMFLSATLGLNGISVHFDEPVTPASALDPSNYSLEGASVTSVEMISDRAVLLKLSAHVSVGSLLEVDQVIDLSEARNPVTSSRLIGSDGILVPFTGIWRYEASNTELGPNWIEPEFDDSNWPEGPALLGASETTLPYPLLTSFPRAEDGSGITTYFRNHFYVHGPVTNLNLRHIIDDGAVFYINGQEIYRTRVPLGHSHTTTASLTVGDARTEGPLSISTDSLVPGTNYFAAELHQSASDSNDAVFGVELTTSPTPSILPPGPPISPTVDIQLITPRHLKLSWSIPEGVFVLETSTNLGGPWTSFSPETTSQSTGSLDRPNRGPTRYFRLREQLTTGAKATNLQD